MEEWEEASITYLWHPTFKLQRNALRREQIPKIIIVNIIIIITIIIASIIIMYSRLGYGK
jgi:hypothetical protein